MKIKTLLIITIMIILVSITASAELEQCEEPIEPLEECKIITPVINCEGAYDYVIINSTNNTVIENNLTEYEAGTYYFNWSMESGEYVIVLCDGTTREVIIGGKNMSLTTTIGILGFVFLLFFVASKIKPGNSIYMSGFKILLGINGLVFMLLIPLSNILTDFRVKFWIYVLWMLRVYAGYALICLLVYAFKKFDIKKRLRL